MSTELAPVSTHSIAVLETVRLAREHLHGQEELTRKNHSKLATSKCCLCGETFKGYGYSAHPVRNEGMACDECNLALAVAQVFRKRCSSQVS